MNGDRVQPRPQPVKAGQPDLASRIRDIAADHPSQRPIVAAFRKAAQR